MATYNIKTTLDQYFLDNWVATPIQYEGTQLNTNALTEFISLQYAPVYNDQYAFDGTTTGRINYVGLQKVFCYAKTPTKAFQLADSVKTFLNGKQLGNIYIEVGQDNPANDLGNNFYEVLITFRLTEWS